MVKRKTPEPLTEPPTVQQSNMDKKNSPVQKIKKQKKA